VPLKFVIETPPNLYIVLIKYHIPLFFRLYGGIFGYPADSKSKRGKLRILYEVFPMAYLIEQAGGKATTGTQNALDIVPEHIHDRSGVWLGSKEDVEELESYYK
jgi:fructose-1,6-bisphosphatase I